MATVQFHMPECEKKQITIGIAARYGVPSLEKAHHNQLANAFPPPQASHPTVGTKPAQTVRPGWGHASVRSGPDPPAQAKHK